MNKFLAAGYAVFAFVSVICLTFLQRSDSFDVDGTAFASCFVTLALVFGFALYNAAQGNSGG